MIRKMVGIKKKWIFGKTVLASNEWHCYVFSAYAECSVFGNAHFSTFDNKTYTFYGKCDYILAEVRDDHETKWQIVLRNDRFCDPMKSCKKQLFITAGKRIFELGKRMGNTFKVKMDSVEILRFPFKKEGIRLTLLVCGKCTSS